MKANNVFRKQDFGIGVAILLFVLVLLPATLSIPKPTGSYPQYAMAFAAFNGVMLIITSIIKKDGTAGKGNLKFSEVLREVIIPGIILFVISMLLKVLGFPICSFILVIVVGIYQKINRNGIKSLTLKYLRFLLVFGAIVGIMVYVNFSLLLHLPTPTGIFGF